MYYILLASRNTVARVADMNLIDRITLWSLKRSAIRIARKHGSKRVEHVERYFQKLRGVA